MLDGKGCKTNVFSCFWWLFPKALYLGNLGQNAKELLGSLGFKEQNNNKAWILMKKGTKGEENTNVYV